ncbi:MAG: BspA family leucine-rich repeat surface protein [Candidatus ainarchaeum sp.]|nr:BspA family leucine-rich repeat surface protein [Candidatus ainarchaeum sp.]
MIKKNVRKKDFVAQASIETLIILAVGLFILTVFTAIVFDQITMQTNFQQKQLGLQSITILAKEVDNVYFLGTGSKKEIVITIPQMVDFSKSYIDDKTFVLNIAGEEVFASSKAKLRGEWPNKSGSYVFVLESFGDFVSVSTATLSFSPIQINETLNQGSSRQIELIVNNTSSNSIGYAFSITPFEGLASISSPFDNSTILFGPKGDSNDSNKIIINLECSNNSAGSYSAMLNFNGIINVSYPINLTCLSGQTKLTIYPNVKTFSLYPNIGESETFLICNNNHLDISNLKISFSGNLKEIVTGELVSNLAANTCASLNLNFKTRLPKSYSGDIIVSGAGIVTNANITANLFSPYTYFSLPTPNNNSGVFFDFFDLNIGSIGSTNVSSFVDFNDSIIGWWRMDDIEGEKLVDYFGDLNGTIYGGAEQVDGKLGKALEFDGSTGYFKIDIPIKESFSLFVWVKSNTPNWNNFGWIASSREKNGFLIHPRLDVKTINFYIYDQSGSSISIGNVAPSNITVWNQYGLIYDNDLKKGYVVLNGEIVSTYNGEILRTPSTIECYFGRDYTNGGRHGDGLIDDLIIFNRALSESEVNALYTNSNEKYDLLNFSNLIDGNYSFKLYSQDLTGSVGSTDLREIELTKSPNIKFVSQTPENGFSTFDNNFDLNIMSVNLKQDDLNVSTVLDFNNSLVSWWRMDDIDGTTLIDLVGDNNGVINNGASQADGVFGKALEFNKSKSQSVSIDHNESLNFSSMSLSFWLQLWNPQGWDALIAKDSWNARLGWLIYYANGRLYYSGAGGGGFNVIFSLDPEKWYQITITNNAGQSKMYINDELVGSGTLNLSNNEVPLRFGARNANTGMYSTDFSSGLIDDIMIFNRALNENEIKAIYGSSSQSYLDVNFSNLDFGEYSFKAYAQDENGYLKSTEKRTINLIDESKIFKSTWNTALLSTGSSGENQIKLPLYNGGSYNFLVDWNDGSTSKITSYNQAEVTHTYDVNGEYTIKIIGEITGFRFNNSGDKLKLIDIKNWGSLRLGNSGNYFYGCANMNSSATDVLDLTGTTNLSNTFNKAVSFDGDIGSWDVSNVTNIGYMFYAASNFNNGGSDSIKDWNTSNITNMSQTFHSTKFNQPVGSWDVSNVTLMDFLFFNTPFDNNVSDWNVSKVTNMRNLFAGTPFNYNISNWDVSNVNIMASMFSSNSYFNQDISSWDVSNVTDMASMFYGAASFNQPIGSWDISKVTNISKLFSLAGSFNQPLGDWNTASVTNMNAAFRGTPFNQDISGWDVSNVIYFGLVGDNYSGMFQTATKFNQDISDWNMSSATDLTLMFQGATDFNQPLNDWDISNVTSLQKTFANATSFNQPLGDWNTSNVTTMYAMFSGATKFNQNIGDWDTSNVISLAGMFTSTDFNNGGSNSINNWDTGNVTNLNGIFRATSFNQPIGDWNTAKVTDMGQIILYNSYFDQDISRWNTSSVTTMLNMLRGNGFNQDISTKIVNEGEDDEYVAWDTSNVTDMSNMFGRAFDQDISNWDVSSVITMSGMFNGSYFNQDISDWNLFNLTNMNLMFQNAIYFNQDLSSWNTTNITTYTDFDKGATAWADENKPIFSS